MSNKMRSDAQIEELRRFRLRRPFRPYKIHLRNGKMIPVERRFQVGVDHKARFAGAYDECNRMVRIRPGDIERVEDSTEDPSQN